MNDKPPTATEVLVLGMLHSQPLHGYELNKLIEERGVRKWANIGFSSIYYLLEKLESRGLVESNGVKSKSRKTYSITTAGKKICKSNTKALIETRVANKNPFMTGLANSFVLSQPAFQKLLESRSAELSRQLTDLKKQMKGQQLLPKPAQYLFSFTVAQMKAEIDWIKNVLKDEG